MKNAGNYIWVFGENVGNTANNNSYYFWKQIVGRNDGIDSYIILCKNKKNLEVYKNLTDVEKKFVIWRNSFKHYKMYYQADMNFVSLSYKDVIPDKLWIKNLKLRVRKPVIYLQHGTLLIKKLGYQGNSYNNNMFRFIYYNKEIKEKMIEQNNFKDYQLYYGEFHPRYKELVRLYNEEKKSEQKQILWFLTWREYLGKNVETDILVRKIKLIVKNKELNEYLAKNNMKLKICLHQFFNEEIGKTIKENNIENIIVVKQNETNIMNEIVKSKMLITDYSSLSFDFTILNKPVILYQPDLEEYSTKREMYCDIAEMKKYNIENSKKLVDCIINEKYDVNEFIKKRCPDKIDYEYLAEGKHIDKMYEYFKDIQENKITFLGYNFYGTGGTISATRSLAEGLLEEGYMVELLSLKRVGTPKNVPTGLNMNYFYYGKSKGKIERLKRIPILWSEKNYSYLKYDPLKKLIKPYAGYALTKKMENIKSKTVISTRESLHLFVKNATSEKVKNKVYFFHCQAKLLNELFPSLLDEFKKIQLEKAVFVTEKNREELEKNYGYNNYDKYWISGNTLESRNCINIEEIEPIEKKELYKAIYLLRISEDRKEDIDNLIKFGEYAKTKNITNLAIDVFGAGNYVEKFLDLLEEKDLMDIIRYKGKTEEPSSEIRKHDFMIDFSLNQSFGMTYIESILNGKMVFCMKNTGSQEVLNDIDGCYIESYDDLIKKIGNITNISKEQLQENYNKIWNKYSRNKISKEFIDFLK